MVRTAREEGFMAVRGNHDNFILSAATGVGRFSDALAPEERLKSISWVQQLSRYVCYRLIFLDVGTARASQQ